MNQIEIREHKNLEGYASIHMSLHECEEVRAFLNNHSIPYDIQEINGCTQPWVQLSTPTPLTVLLRIIRSLLPKEDTIHYTHEDIEYSEPSVVRALSFVFQLHNLYMYLNFHGIEVDDDICRDLSHYLISFLNEYHTTLFKR